MLGKTYFMLGDFPRSVGELEAALKLSPKDYDIAYTLGLAHLKQHEFAPAKQIYDRMLAQLGDRPQLHIIFGRAYRETSFLPEAIDEFTWSRITEEPESGSPQPTGTVVVNGEL